MAVFPMFYKFIAISLFLMAFPFCSVLKKKPSLTFKAEQIFQKGKSFGGLKVGGLSEISFDKNSGYFYAISDDKKNHRFYKLVLKTDPCCQMQIKEQIFLKSPGHKTLKINMDPEALVPYEKDGFFIASEGQQIYKVHEPTQIFTFDRHAVLKEVWPVPPVFWKAGQKRQEASFGQQENKGFESLTLNHKSKILWTATEKALKQDLIFKEKSFVRLSTFDIAHKTMLAQYIYALHDKENGGLTALQFLRPKVLLSLERSYKKQKNNGANEAHLFLTDCRKASNVQFQIQLTKGFQECSKFLLWDSSKNPAIQVDNLEGLALGPVLPSKKRLLVLVSDNNFNEEKQKNQFLFFELVL